MNFSVYEGVLFIIFSPTCFGRSCCHLQGVVGIRRIQTYQCG